MSAERVTELWRECGGGTDAYDAERNVALLYAEGILRQRRTFRQLVEGAMAVLSLPVERHEELARQLSADLAASGYAIHDRAACIRLGNVKIDHPGWSVAEALEKAGPDMAARVALGELVDGLNSGALKAPDEHAAGSGIGPAAVGSEQSRVDVPVGSTAPTTKAEPAASPPGRPAPPSRRRPRAADQSAAGGTCRKHGLPWSEAPAGVWACPMARCSARPSAEWLAAQVPA